MPDTTTLRPATSTARERRPSPAGQPAAAPPRNRDEAPQAVTPYDEIWFQGRPQLP